MTLHTPEPDRAAQVAWVLGAVGAVLAVVSLLTGWLWLTLVAVGILVSGVVLLAWDTRID